MVKIEFYILGLLKFDSEEIVFSDKQLNQVRKCFNKRFGNPEKRDPYHVWFLEKYFKKILAQIKTDVKFKIIRCELGYYHHRAMFRLDLDVEEIQAFEFIRAIRNPLHLEVRKILNETLPEKIEADGEHSATQILYAYTYPFVIIQDGRKIIKKQLKDAAFSISTTTFFLEIPETSLIRLRTHYVRVSIPSVIVFSDKQLGDSVFRELVNSIYYAALYAKKLQHVGVGFKIKRDDENLNKMDEGILRGLNSYLLQGVVINERQKIDTRTKTTALAISVAAILISVITALLMFVRLSVKKLPSTPASGPNAPSRTLFEFFPQGARQQDDPVEPSALVLKQLPILRL